MSTNDFAYFQIAAKAILKKDSSLVLQWENQQYDFPGGRMDLSEINLSLHEVLQRELTEELGPDFRYKIGDIAFVTKRLYHQSDPTKRILAVYYEVEYISGTIKLSDEHVSCEWVEPTSILGDESRFISPDEYAQYTAYCQKLGT